MLFNTGAVLRINASIPAQIRFLFLRSFFIFLYLLSFPFYNLKKQAIKIDSLLTNIYSIISKDFRILHSSFPTATGSVRLYSLGINNENTLSM